MITHVVFSGGGIKGFCYLGIIRYLYIENLVKNIKYISGASIGAYFGLVLALQIPIDFIENEISIILENIKTNNNLTISKNNFSELFTTFGFLSLDFMMTPILNYLKLKYNIEDITFIDFIKKTGINLYVFTTCINTASKKIFSADDTPNISVIDAVKASMTIPFLFKSSCIEDEYYIDGVISNSVPMNIFKTVPKENKLCVIIYSGTDEDPMIYAKGNKLDFFLYFSRSIYIMLKNLLSNPIEKYKLKDDLHILKINNLPYAGTFKFKITNKEIIISVSQEEVDNLTLKGYIEIFEYMKKKRK